LLSKKRSKTKNENSPKPVKGQDKNMSVDSADAAVFQPEFAEKVKMGGESNNQVFSAG